MTERDFESRLDDALKQITFDAPFENLNGSELDTAELVQVAQRLQILAPAPAPRLTDGRRRFLNQAARSLDQSKSISDWVRRVAHRPALAVAIVLVLIVFAASAMMVFSQSSPALQITSTQTSAPTFTATPTKISLAPDDARAGEPQSATDSHHLRIPEPQPVPAPVISAIKLTSFND